MTNEQLVTQLLLTLTTKIEHRLTPLDRTTVTAHRARIRGQPDALKEARADLLATYYNPSNPNEHSPE